MITDHLPKTMSLQQFATIMGLPIVGFYAVATYPDGTTEARTLSGPDAIQKLLEWGADNDARQAKVTVKKLLKGTSRRARA